MTTVRTRTRRMPDGRLVMQITVEALNELLDLAGAEPIEETP